MTVSMRLILLFLLIVISIVPATRAQSSDTSKTHQTNTVPAGAKMKFKGVVISRDADVFIIRDRTRADYKVLITNDTSVRAHGSFFRSGNRYPVTDILRGLIIEVEGRGDSQGNLIAEKIRFDESDWRAAITAETRVSPVEANQQRMTGQMDELYAVAAEARSQVTAVNERISALDDYDVQASVGVTFRTNSAVLLPEAKQELDALAEQIKNAKGYVIEVAGHTDSIGSQEKNFRLSQARADAVVQYLAVNHQIPLRRFVTPMGYGKTEAVADNSNAAGRAHNRRVEVKMYVNRGLATSQGLREFPWPPTASALMAIDRNFLLRPGQSKSLKEIGDHLQAILIRAGYGQGSFYGVPGGFALASRMEHFTQNSGAPLPGNDRWVIGIVPPPIFSMAHLRSFVERLSGSYRVIVFVVTDSPFQGGSEAVTSEHAQTLYIRGSNTLPEEPFRHLSYSNSYTCTALIYEFKQTNADRPPEFQTTSALQASTHLEMGGISPALRNMPR